jgi:hypothetical protein
MLRILKTFSKISIKLIVSLLLGAIGLFLILYAGTAIYDFPKTAPFSGQQIYNPYDDVGIKSYKSNFHAHSKAWAGATNGKNTENEVIEAYIEKGYDVACLSNYQKISPYTGQKSIIIFPVYEHGYSMKKAHYLAINAKDVVFWDFPLWQSSSHQQTITNKLRANADIVAIAHPKFGGGRTFENMEQLTGYHLIEVLNHYRNSEEYWDRALSVGRLSWIIGNDDIHDIKDPEIFQIWNNIFSAKPEEILLNLKNGKNYATQSFTKQAENKLLSCKKTGENSFEVVLEKPADIDFIGQNGALKQKSTQKDTASYTFANNDTYIRVVARNQNSAIYLNPLVRYDGKSLIMASDLEAKQDHIMTWVWRLGFLLAFAIFGYLWIKLIRW